MIWALWKEVSSLIRLWFYKFLYDHLLRIGYGLECDFLPIHIHVFIFMGEFLVVGRVYRSCDCSHGRVTSLGRLNHFSHGIFGVVWESRRILLVLHARHCVWKKIDRRAYMKSYSYLTVLLMVLHPRVYHLLGAYFILFLFGLCMIWFSLDGYPKSKDQIFIT